MNNVLLIDDEEGFVTTLAERLELRGINASFALNGQDGLDLIAQNRPEVIVLDLRMPGLSGLETLRRIRASWPELPVIMLSGHGSDTDFQTCMDLGAAMYHKKPLDIDVLLDSMRAVRGEKDVSGS